MSAFAKMECDLQARMRDRACRYTALRCIVPSLLLLALAACTSADFFSTTRTPDAQPLGLKGAKVAAVVMMNDQARRRGAENALAEEISRRGAVGVPMHSIYSDPTPANEPAARAALEKAQIQGVVVMRPVSVSQDAETTAVTYSEPMYREYWGSYYGAGWGTPYGMATVSGGDTIMHTTVIVETVVYSMKQNKLVWSGQSKHTDPANLEKTIRQLAKATAREIESEGLIGK